MPRSETSIRSLRRFGTAKTLAYSSIVFVLALLFLELTWRTYLYASGRGFFDDPEEFISPFFTAYDEPAPIKSRSTARYRDSATSIPKSEGEIRIVCFGGSTTVNHRAGISYSQILDVKFSETPGEHSTRVFNAGGEGFSTAHTLVNLSLRNLDIDPDVIVVYHNINDLSVKDFGDWSSSDYANKYKSDFYLGFRHRAGALAAATKISRLARFIVSSIGRLAFPTNEYGEAGRTSRTNDYSQVLVYFENNLRSIAAVAKEHGIRLVLLSQAARSDFRTDLGFVAFNDAIRKIAKQEDAVFVDVASAMTDDTLFLEDSIHYTRAGVERLAEILYPDLQHVVDQITSARAR
jgi:lysophospholipase L1-like esterase